MEIVAHNIDRLISVEIESGASPIRGIITALYEASRKTVGDRPLTLVAAESIIKRVSDGDNVIFLTGYGCLPMYPHGETDGPPGSVSLARAVNLGLGAVPVFVAGERDIPTIQACMRAAGIHVEDYETTQSLKTAGTIVPLPYDEKEARRAAQDIMEKYKPKAVIAVEATGPNKKGILHSRRGYDFGPMMSKVYQVFEEANKRGVLTIGCIDNGNEVGSGTIEETVRKINPFGDKCCCPVGAGIACAIKSDICIPAGISNWAAYGVAAMLALFLKDKNILHSTDMERLMLEACARTGCSDAHYARPLTSVDGKSLETQQSVVTLLHEIVRRGLTAGTSGRTAAFMIR